MTHSNPTFCPLACFAEVPYTIADPVSPYLDLSSSPQTRTGSRVVSPFLNCLTISLWIALQKSSTVHLPRRSTTGDE
jgi:hypothetical protein